MMMSNKKDQFISIKRINALKQLTTLINLERELNKLSNQEKEKTLTIINEALTHTSAKENYNHERLEFLGDAVLRLAASEFIDQQYPKLQVGERSSLRAQLVSDRWLGQIGKKINIKKVLIVGAQAAGDSSALSTLEAEATEALIGALYESPLGMKSVHIWLEPFWEETSKAVLSDPYKFNSKSALQEWSQKKGLKLPVYLSEEKNQKHGNSKRFFSLVKVNGEKLGNGWGQSRREAEQEAARKALEAIKTNDYAKYK